MLREKQNASAGITRPTSSNLDAFTVCNSIISNSKPDFDLVKVNIGVLPAGKECRVTLRYVTELDLINGSSMRFVLPTTVAPRYYPVVDYAKPSNVKRNEYVQNTTYWVHFQAHVLRGEQCK